MFEPIGILKGEGQPIYRTKIGNDILNVSRVGRHFHTLFNRRSIMAAKSDKEFFEKCAPVLATIIRLLCQKNNGTQAKHTKMSVKFAGVTDELVKFLWENENNAKIFVLEEKPDEMQENKPKEDFTRRSFDLTAYAGYLKEISANVEEIKRLSDILLRTHLAKDMWGSKEVTSVINGIKSEMMKLGDYSEMMDRCLEQSDNNVRLVQGCIENNRIHDHARSAAGKVVENFSSMKTYLAELAQVLHKLYNIDATFKKYTGYPASWFIMSSILMDFVFEFENLIGNMLKTASIESSIIEPLLVWKIKMTGDA